MANDEQRRCSSMRKLILNGIELGRIETGRGRADGLPLRRRPCPERKSRHCEDEETPNGGAKGDYGQFKKVERETRIELATNSLEGKSFVDCTAT